MLKLSYYTKLIQGGVAENLDSKPLPVYKEGTHNRFTEAVIGYTEVEDNIFIGIVKNVLFTRICIILIITALLGGGITTAANYNSWFVNGKAMQTGGTKPNIDPNAQDWKGALPNANKGGATNGIAIPGYKSISLKANKLDQTVSQI